MSLPQQTPPLSIHGLSSRYGRIEALRGIDLTIEAGEIVTLIGANGAGKTTLLMTICGDPRAATGEIRLHGEAITHLPTHEIVRRGVALVPEGRRIFSRMSVLENLRMGSTPVRGPHDTAVDLARVFARFPVLKERRRQRAGTLSGGEQQMLAISRALMGHPQLLLLDEPSLGLAPMLMREIFTIIREINRQEGIAILLVEQNAHHALKLAGRGFVLVNGRIAMSGTGDELLKSEAVRAAYLEGG
uniref:Branched-chain amino acid transport system ATP-binding protein n=1 Tax=Candidatus Kentrum eta TaxID=2126337 RepID=A0A450UKM0_9GAMM|nr:MAG: branched-chain amino acid transport system ATP-binding protein [Candidatus Kentron sp. H]VFJ93747.1 MAG: branched-chain amino acid transport system ATP-binding protein [Candidatus Kentron sp. H]VFK00579.1 MAG: branched-chain amino acid transport system ATP-binding protein [Candidatus Kentron sp. H]